MGLDHRGDVPSAGASLSNGTLWILCQWVFRNTMEVPVNAKPTALRGGGFLMPRVLEIRP